METLTAIRTRKSIRKFLNREIPPEVIRTILEAGVSAPSGGNCQPWRFVVSTDRGKIKQFDPYGHQACVEEAPAVIVACADPHATWARYDEQDDCYLLDTAAAIQNMLLAIHDLGLGAVWVISCSPRDIRKLLGIPLHWKIVSIICLGYYDPNDPVNTPARSRRPLADVAFFNSLDNPMG